MDHRNSRGRAGRPTIGVLAGWQYYWTATPLSYLAPLFRAIRLAAGDLGCNLLLGCGMGPSATAADPFRPAWPEPAPDSDFVPIGPWNTDGIIAVNPLHSDARARYLHEVMAAGHPVLFVASGQAGPTIVADNAGGILEAMRHLVGHGHRQIAFIAGNPDDLEGDTGTRLRAYGEALRVHGLAADERLVAYGQHTYGGGCAAMAQILAAQAPQSDRRLTAVLASNDESAMGAMQALREAGRRIPQDVAVIGFDDRPESVVQEPALSSVHVPLFELGYRSVEMLLRQIRGRGAPAEPTQVPTRLMPRASCGCGVEPAEGAPAPRPDERLHSSDERLKSSLRPGSNDFSRSRPGSNDFSRSLAAAMAAAVLAEAQELDSVATHALCQRLVAALAASVNQGDRQEFRNALDAVLQPPAAGRPAESGAAGAAASSSAGRDDPHLWQAAISVLRERLPELLGESSSEVLGMTREWLDAARTAISAAMWRRHRLHVTVERQARDRVSLLSARLLAALDEAQAYEILAQYLPEMGVRTAAVALLEGEGDDPVAWSRLQTLVPAGAPLPTGAETVRFRSRDYPPAGLADEDEPFSLALVPLSGPRGQLGYVTFDAASPELYGTIVQQLAASLNTAQLYREATEGRRLAEEANRLKSRFLSMVSHELRTPLSLIVGLSGILLSPAGDQGLPEPYRHDIERILANAQHLGWLINDVLDLASSEAGQLRLANDLVDLSEVLRAVAATGRQLAADKGLAWREALPESGPWVRGDRTRLRQIGLNLVHNAVKFTAQGEVRLALVIESGVRILRCERGGRGGSNDFSRSGRVTVEVHDTGLGIPPDEQELVFSEFGRTERSVSRGFGGLGLGLAICKRLVELHGGTIAVRSAGLEGSGSTFSFTLPTVPAPVAETTEVVTTSEGRPRAVVPAAAPTAESVLVLTGREAQPGGLPTAGEHQPQAGRLWHGGAVERLAEELAGRGIRAEIREATPDWMAEVLALQPGALVLDATLAAEESWRMALALRNNPATQEIALLLYAHTDEGTAVFELDSLAKPISRADLAAALDRRLTLGEGDKETRRQGDREGPAARGGRAPAHTMPGTAGHAVLVVDDNPDTVEMHARIVRAHSPAARVITARGGREALEVLRRERVDLVLLDLLMPEMDGFAVLEAMRETPALRDVPVIVVTGQVLTEGDMARLNRGVATVLGKGLFSLDETLAHVDAALARRRKLGDETSRLVRQAMAYLHQHYADAVSRQELARHVGMDEDYLTACFRKELGVTPVAYLNRYRVNQAKRLLAETGKSVTEIAMAVGFSDSGYFSRVFRREAGCSPEAYRRSRPPSND